VNNIPAFPRPFSGTTQYAQEGMTLRDYFAAKAMQGFLASFDEEDPQSSQGFATVCYALADAMMEARNAAQ
jgi:hypothetical protein